MSRRELMPSGGHRKKADPKRIKKILEGGKKAEEIRKKAEEYHKAKEVPSAEEQLMKDLKNI